MYDSKRPLSAEDWSITLGGCQDNKPAKPSLWERLQVRIWICMGAWDSLRWWTFVFLCIKVKTTSIAFTISPCSWYKYIHKTVQQHFIARANNIHFGGQSSWPATWWCQITYISRSLKHQSLQIQYCKQNTKQRIFIAIEQQKIVLNITLVQHHPILTGRGILCKALKRYIRLDAMASN